MKVNALSCPGLINSLKPPWRYFAGRPLQFIAYMHAEVMRVEVKNKAKPSQFSKPNIPATAPAKQDERNFTVVRDWL